MTVQQLEQLDQGQGRLGFAVFVRVANVGPDGRTRSQRRDQKRLLIDQLPQM